MATMPSFSFFLTEVQSGVELVTNPKNRKSLNGIRIQSYKRSLVLKVQINLKVLDGVLRHLIMLVV
jgi:hypothetical protein